MTTAAQRDVRRPPRRKTASTPSNTSALVIASAPAFPVSGPPRGVKYTAGSKRRVEFEYWLSGTSAVHASPTASAAARRGFVFVARHTPITKHTSAMTNAMPARARTVSAICCETSPCVSVTARTSNRRRCPDGVAKHVRADAVSLGGRI